MPPCIERQGNDNEEFGDLASPGLDHVGRKQHLPQLRAETTAGIPKRFGQEIYPYRVETTRAANTAAAVVFPSEKAVMCYLASFPRSGNSLLRLIFYHRFGVKTGSVYGSEFPDWPFEDLNSRYQKTHELFRSDMAGKHIYIERDPDEVERSIEAYFRGRYNRPKWGTHREHIASWRKSGALWLKFGDLKTNETLDRLSGFLKREVIPNSVLPEFTTLNAADPKVFRQAGL